MKMIGTASRRIDAAAPPSRISPVRVTAKRARARDRPEHARRGGRRRCAVRSGAARSRSLSASARVASPDIVNGVRRVDVEPPLGQVVLRNDEVALQLARGQRPARLLFGGERPEHEVLGQHAPDRAPRAWPAASSARRMSSGTARTIAACDIAVEPQHARLIDDAVDGRLRGCSSPRSTPGSRRRRRRPP